MQNQSHDEYFQPYSLTNDQESLNGLSVTISHLHFLLSTVQRCSQHSLPIVSVFLLRGSINKILWVKLVPPLSAPVFMCVFICKCAFCGCLCVCVCVFLRRLLSYFPAHTSLSFLSYCDESCY